MDNFVRLVKEANRSFRAADHLTYVTYPLIKDSKLISNIAENLDRSLTTALDAFLCYERLYKRTSLRPDDFDLKVNVFRDSCVGKNNITEEHVKLIRFVREIVRQHRESKTEFQRDDRFVIVINGFRTRTLMIEDMKKLLTKAKPFILVLNNILKDDLRRRSF